MAPFEFRLADVGEGIHEVEILAWKVRPGDQVQAFDPLCEIESAKAAVELTSPVAGHIRETRVPVGGTARVGEVLVVIDRAAPAGPASAAPAATLAAIATASPVAPAGPSTPGSPAAPAVSLAPTFAPAPGVAGAPLAAPAPAAAELPAEDWFGIVGAPPREAAISAPPVARTENAVRAAPLVRKLARERGVRLEDVAGSGPDGRVRLADLEAYVARLTPAPAVGLAPAPAVADGEERLPLQGLRKRVAAHMVEAVRHAPQVTAMDVFDVTALVQAREVLRPVAEREGVRLTYLPFFLRAAIEALRAVPTANATFDEAGEAILVKRHYNLGIATAVPGGLIVPVLKRAETRSLIELASESARLIDAARARRTPPEDLRDGTFTITSFGGMPGSPLFATPILNYPEVAILGLGRIEEQPRVVAGQVVPRHCLGVSFTFDHRVLDGAGAGDFLAALRRYLEQPLELLLRLR
jgi:pyruvate dehydrogenase E2 component (dihydrolipoamide acetyltransferase)